MKYILVTGGVISGIGKGITSSSVGALLKCCGYKVTAIKIDPYLNIDAGTFSPYEHGEVYVLDDGGEVDLDLGNYERFLDLTLTKDNNITTGKIYSEIIRKERLGEFMGKTVQVVPHVTNEIQERITKIARLSVDKSGQEPDICIIELGGTIGDIESAPFVEAFRQFQFRVGSSNFLNIHVSLVPCQSGELKSKPTQHSVKDLRAQGISPDILVCRSNQLIGQELREKLSMFCQVPTENVICVEDANVIYEVPIRLYRQRVHELVLRKLDLPFDLSIPRRDMRKWKCICEQYKKPLPFVKIGLVGKYVRLDDAYLSVNKALSHAALECGFKLELIKISAEHLSSDDKSDEYLDSWKQLTKVDGVIIPGGFDKRGVEGKIIAIRYCRENMKPILGVCLGMQCMVIEYARNMLNYDDANSSEFDTSNLSQHQVVIEMPEFNPEQKGGTMRLGKRETFFHVNNPKDGDKPCKIHLLYNSVLSIHERHRHRYEVNPSYIQKFESCGMKFVGRDKEEERMEILELDDHPYFVGTQYHPEYLSRPTRPSPPYLGLIMASKNCLQRRLRLSRERTRTRTDSILTDEEDDVLYKDMNHNGHLLVSNGN